MPVLVCSTCGYDSEGLPSALCPECGQSLPPVPVPAVPRLRVRLCLAALIVAFTPVVGYVTTVLPRVPRIWGPLPLMVLIPEFILGRRGVAALVPIGVVALALSLPIALGRARIPWWTGVPIFLALLLDWFFFAVGWRYGVQYQGTKYVVVCGLIQLAFSAALLVLLAINSLRRFWIVAVWHSLAALWLASYAFPYYGELP